jgi:hypothetical protein
VAALRRAHAHPNRLVHPHLLAVAYLQSGVSANCRPGEDPAEAVQAALAIRLSDPEARYPQYSSASITVRTRVVTVGSAGSGEPAVRVLSYASILNRMRWPATVSMAQSCSL